MLITFEGGDGCGKSTQIQLFCGWLRERGVETVQCRDPGSTPLGDAIREILLGRKDLRIGSTSEMLLFMSARAQLVEEIIAPALESGKVVLSDRFLLSNFVYQSCAGGLPLESLRAVGEIATAGTLPDLGFVLDLPYEIALQRMGSRGNPDRMESKGEEYHRRVREGFLELAAEDSQRYVVINAEGPIANVQQSLREIFLNRIAG